MQVIPNGFDVEEFAPLPHRRSAVRHSLGIPRDAAAIGLIARFHPVKDHGNFVAAASRLHKRFPDAHFVLCGEDVTWENVTLAHWIEHSGIRSVCHLLGKRTDMPSVLSALDVAVSASSSEGFPNVVGEAMACGVPCVVTDVGDSAQLVGDTGRVVPPRNPEALAQACRELIETGSEGRGRLGQACRRRIEQRFSLPVVVQLYQDLYAGVTGRSQINRLQHSLATE